MTALSLLNARRGVDLLVELLRAADEEEVDAAGPVRELGKHGLAAEVPARQGRHPGEARSEIQNLSTDTNTVHNATHAPRRTTKTKAL